MKNNKRHRCAKCGQTFYHSEIVFKVTELMYDKGSNSFAAAGKSELCCHACINQPRKIKLHGETEMPALYAPNR